MPVTVVKRADATPDSFARSVFLAAADGAAWEAAAIEELGKAGFDDGVIFVGDDAPEPDGGGWRAVAMKMSDAIVCYVPEAGAVGGAVQGDDGLWRPTAAAAMSPYLATEIARWVGTGQLFCAAPEGSWADELCAGATHKVAPERSLVALVAKVFKAVKAGAEREAAERTVPLMIWQTPSWGLWYENLKVVGNRLDGAKVDWTFRVGPGGVFTLFWAVHANIWVESEQRNKSNEVVVSRPDVCCTLAYVAGESMLDTEIIVIKEFRSPCRNEYGFVYELPGGSSFKPNSDVYQTAAAELFEETGIRVEKARLRKEMSRQAAATVTTHHVHLFSVELTDEEMHVAKKCAEERTMFGNADETEQTYIETITLREAIPSTKLDFNCLGMIMQTIGIFYDNQQAKEEQQMAERLSRLGLESLVEEGGGGGGGAPGEGMPPSRVNPAAAAMVGSEGFQDRGSKRNAAKSTVDALGATGIGGQSESSRNSSIIIEGMVQSMEESEVVKSVLAAKVTELQAEVARLQAQIQAGE